MGTLGDETLLSIVLSGSYIGVKDCHNSKKSTFKIGALNYM